ncbi:hypothetical protein HAX54_019133 [Datura stramonium]|uniref:Uncharacterized protein n=1 Tax=Datura stramonium TaxID=4076 RepID=A0ABS8UQQ1_DATST|nr:hypothetical protein [Datura stramonium]
MAQTSSNNGGTDQISRLKQLFYACEEDSQCEDDNIKGRVAMILSCFYSNLVSLLKSSSLFSVSSPDTGKKGHGKAFCAGGDVTAVYHSVRQARQRPTSVDGACPHAILPARLCPYGAGQSSLRHDCAHI